MTKILANRGPAGPTGATGPSGGGSSTAQLYGFVSWSFESGETQSSTQLTGGVLYGFRQDIRTSGTTTKVWWQVGAVGVTPTAGQNWIGLYDSNGNLLNQVAADTAATIGVGVANITIPTTTVTAGNFYYIVFLWNCATTPSLGRASSSSSTSNANTTTGTYRYFNTLTAQTTLPATISISGTPQFAFWSALS